MARELIAIAAAFGLLIVLSQRTNIWQGLILLASGALMGLLAGQGIDSIARHFMSGVLTPTAIKTLAVVLQIGILGHLMKHYGLLDKLVGAFQDLFSSEKKIMMLLPAAIGMLTVPGGAQLSSPFVYELGESLHMPVHKRAAVNLSYRHIAYFILPTTSAMIIFSGMAPHISLYRLIALNAGYVLMVQTASYFCYLRGYGGGAKKRSSQCWRGLVNVIKYLFPIYIVLVLNGFFAVEMYAAMAISLLCILALWGRRDLAGYWQVFKSSVNYKVLVMLIGVFFMQSTIKDMNALMTGCAHLFVRYSGAASLLVIAVTAVFFGISTGLSYVPLGILMPMVLALKLPAPLELLYCFAVYTWSFAGYYFSPLHLCQILTAEQMQCSSSTLYKTHVPLMAVMFTAPFVLFYVYKLILM